MGYHTGIEEVRRFQPIWPSLGKTKGVWINWLALGMNKKAPMDRIFKKPIPLSTLKHIVLKSPFTIAKWYSALQNRIAPNTKCERPLCIWKL